MNKKIVYLCDWLPPDFGAVGQYSLLFSEKLAIEGDDVTLVGFSSESSSTIVKKVNNGCLCIVKIKVRPCDKINIARRVFWAIEVNAILILKAFKFLKQAEKIIFTGSPPLLIHFLVPLNFIFRKQLIYRITDFHPECLMATRNRIPFGLRAFYKLTVFWRKKVDRFQVLGEDQRARLHEIGINDDKISLVRDPSPVSIGDNDYPLEVPEIFSNKIILMYSGNWGVAHDYNTFIDGYRKHHREGSGQIVLWLNATGVNSEVVETALKNRELPVYRSHPVPLNQLGRLLITPDIHLITLRDEFVGFVLPSKVYGCIESKKAILFLGSKRSDVNLLCEQQVDSNLYQRVHIGDIDGCFNALESLAKQSKEKMPSSENKI